MEELPVRTLPVMKLVSTLKSVCLGRIVLIVCSTCRRFVRGVSDFGSSASVPLGGGSMFS